MGSKRDSSNNPKRAATAAFKRPKQVGITAGIDHPHLAVGSNDFSLEQPRCRRTETLRKYAETAALYEPRDAHRHAVASLDVATALGFDCIVEIHPYRSGFGRDSRCWSDAAFATFGHERIVQDDPVHPASPDEQRVRRVGRTLVAVGTALYDEPQIIRAGESDSCR